LVSTIKWRCEKQPSKITTNDIIEILKLDYVYFHMEDNEGNPISWVHVKHHLHYSGKDKQYEDLVLWMMEWGLRKWREGTIKTARATIVFDQTDFSMSNMDYHLVKFLVDTLQAHYPEVLAHIYVVDAPWIFQACWKLIKGWLDPITAAKIVFVTKEELKQHINPEYFPERFGGTSVHQKQWENQ